MKFFPSLNLAISGFIVGASLSTAAAILERATGRTSPPSGCLVVRNSGTQTGEYSTLTSALSALGSGTNSRCIFIYSGTYQEQVTISYGGPLTLYGYTTDVGTYKSNTVTITHSVNSATAGSLDLSSTVNIRSSDFNAYNVNFANTYGSGAQAVAVTANGDRQGFYGCSFTGYQDTLYAKKGYQYYSNCYVEGATDYIFGDANAWFGECTIVSSGAGYITAMSRETASDTSWYIFDHCTVQGKSGVSLSKKVYLGRPWRVLARVMYQYNSLSDIINPDGWTTMAEGATPLYYEYGNTGDGSSTSARKYETPTSTSVAKSVLWPTGYSWIDTSY